MRKRSNAAFAKTCIAASKPIHRKSCIVCKPIALPRAILAATGPAGASRFPNAKSSTAKHTLCSKSAMLTLDADRLALKTVIDQFANKSKTESSLETRGLLSISLPSGAENPLSLAIDAMGIQHSVFRYGTNPRPRPRDRWREYYFNES